MVKGPVRTHCYSSWRKTRGSMISGTAGTRDLRLEDRQGSGNNKLDNDKILNRINNSLSVSH